MSDSIKITIPAEGFTAAGRTLGVNLSTLSPFRVEAEGSQERPSKEVMNGNKVREDLLPAFATLAGTQAMGACAYLSTSTLMDVSFYYPSLNAATPPVSLSMVDEGICMQSPPDLEGPIAWLGQHFGDSLVRTCSHEAKMSLADTLILFAVVDAARRRIFAILAGSSENDPMVLSFDNITSALSWEVSDETETLQWLAPNFAESHSLGSPGAVNLENCLRALAQKRYLTIQGKDIVLDERLALLATNFLTVSGYLRLQAADTDSEGRTRATEVHGIRGQGNAVLLWTDDGTKVQLLGVSPAQALGVARNMLANPGGYPVEAGFMAAVAAPTPAAFDAPVVIDKTMKDRKPRKKRQWRKIALIILAIAIVVFILLLIDANM